MEEQAIRPVQVEAANFGPIRRAKIDLAPLTVLIGQNNSGKSFMSALLYAAALHPSSRNLRFPANIRVSRKRGFVIVGGPSITEPKRDEREAFEEWMPPPPAGYPPLSQLPSAVKTFLTRVLREGIADYAAELGKEIERCLGSKLRELVRSGSEVSRFRLLVRHPRPRWAVELGLKQGRPHVVKVQEPSLSAALRHVQVPERRRGVPVTTGLFDLQLAVLQACFLGFPTERHFLPAARSGILQSHRALAAFVVSQSPLAGIQELDIPRMTGVVTDFIEELLTLESDYQSDLSHVASFLEREVLQGAIRMRSGARDYPEISYLQRRKNRIPLHRTSSMVSELAPVVLYLRYLVDSGELLVVEEPESHLHPDSQRRFARAIARLVSAQAKLVVTTHSDYFLTQTNNLIQASQLSPEGLSKLGLTLKDCVDPANVAAYLFRSQTRNRGTVVEKLTIDAREGVSDVEFSRVAEELYEQTVLLEHRLRREHSNSTTSG